MSGMSTLLQLGWASLPSPVPYQATQPLTLALAEEDSEEPLTLRSRMGILILTLYPYPPPSPRTSQQIPRCWRLAERFLTRVLERDPFLGGLSPSP